MNDQIFSFKKQIWNRFRKNKIAITSFYFLVLVSFIGIYAPFFASSKPLFVRFEGKFYFPLFRYLFFPGFYTKPIDLFFNILMFILPITLLGMWAASRFWSNLGMKIVFGIGVSLQCILTIFVIKGAFKNPEFNPTKQARLYPDFDFDLRTFTEYEKLNLALKYQKQKEHKEKLTAILEKTSNQEQIATLIFEASERRRLEEIENLKNTICELEEAYEKAIQEISFHKKAYIPYIHDLTIKEAALKEATGDITFIQKNYDVALVEEKKAKKSLQEAEDTIDKYLYAKARKLYLEKKNSWLQNTHLTVQINPLFRSFHWEEDAGGGQSMNSLVPWYERTRLNRKDLTAALIFGLRVSLIVGFSAVILSLAIGIPLGLFAGYFAGKVDMFVLRFIEIWEAMPTFFTLLLISAIFHSKSLFLTIMVLGLFGWTSFARYIRAESLRERSLAYVLASKSLGFRNKRIMFSHVLPNVISPILALLPFSMMAAITSEAALSFLGLGEENSTSWGVLMSEARTVFPGESYLLWPPALLLTAFLVAIALVGDGVRDALDPKMDY